MTGNSCARGAISENIFSPCVKFLFRIVATNSERLQCHGDKRSHQRCARTGQDSRREQHIGKLFIFAFLPHLPHVQSVVVHEVLECIGKFQRVIRPSRHGRSRFFPVNTMRIVANLLCLLHQLRV